MQVTRWVGAGSDLLAARPIRRTAALVKVKPSNLDNWTMPVVAIMESRFALPRSPELKTFSKLPLPMSDRLATNSKTWYESIILMEKSEFVQRLSNALDKDLSSVDESTLLDQLEWDSLSAITFIALASDLLNKNVDSSQVQNSKTLGELYNNLF